jgi:hypothetical protein
VFDPVLFSFISGLNVSKGNFPSFDNFTNSAKFYCKCLVKIVVTLFFTCDLIISLIFGCLYLCVDNSVKYVISLNTLAGKPSSYPALLTSKNIFLNNTCSEDDLLLHSHN